MKTTGNNLREDLKNDYLRFNTLKQVMQLSNSTLNEFLNKHENRVFDTLLQSRANDEADSRALQRKKNMSLASQAE